MDNCEHLVDDVAALVESVALRCVEVRVLATSREALALDGEEVIPVKPLDGSAGVELFLERARGVGATLDSRRVGAVGEICCSARRLPLAIELAAARAACR